MFEKTDTDTLLSGVSNVNSQIRNLLILKCHKNCSRGLECGGYKWKQTLIFSALKERQLRCNPQPQQVCL